jgi:hypothetical protein
MLRSTLLRNSALAAVRRQTAQSSVRLFSAATEKKEEEEKGLMYNILTDHRVQLPIGFLAAIPLLQHQVIVLSEETQLLGCFMVFVATVYTQAGDAIAKALDARGEAIIAEHSAQEDKVIDAVTSLMDAHRDRINGLQDMKLLYQTNMQLCDMIAETKTMELQHLLRVEVSKRIENAANSEEQFKIKMQSLLVDKATDQVKSKLQNKELQTQALNEALAFASDSSKKGDVDLVGKLYSTYFNDISSTLKNQKEPVQMSKESIEAAQAEVLALRARYNNDDKDVSSFPTTLRIS